MNLGDDRRIRRRRIIVGVIAALILSFLLAFRSEIRDVLGILWNLFLIVWRTRPLGEWATEAQQRSLILMTFTFGLGFIGIFVFWLLILSARAILPVDGFIEAYRAAYHLMLYILKQHGPAVVVRNGNIENTKEDVRLGPGVAVVDFNSAIVLESRTPKPGITRVLAELVHSMLLLIGLTDHAQNPRVAGPGIVYTRRVEFIRGAVDLRKQFRSQPDVTAYTRDGIEVSTRIFSTFTIGQPADILQVTYDGDQRPENLAILTLEPVPDGHFRVTGMEKEIERRDRDEIHHAIQVIQRNQDWHAYTSLLDTNTPPTYNPERVFAAVFSEAWREKSKNKKSPATEQKKEPPPSGEQVEKVPWTELPARVAASFFREMLSQVNYDQLYGIGTPEPNPLPHFKSRMRLAMRNNGILSYRVLMNISREPLVRRRIYPASEFVVSTIRPLQNPKILRDRGIKVLMAGFGDVLPVNEAIYKHRLASWKASWQRDTDLVNASSELAAMRVRSRARALAQQDLITSLNGILQQADMPQEVMAVRILQALEILAANTTTKDLLPGGTLDVLKTTREWLLPALPNAQWAQGAQGAQSAPEAPPVPGVPPPPDGGPDV